jgi:DNA-binding SARP family transcriptional activator/tetratricopeptide (TPR) repeat protein
MTFSGVRQSDPSRPPAGPAPGAGPFRFQVLGALGVTCGGRPVRLGGPRQRTVLGLLLVRAPREVTTAQLVDAVWPDDPPASAERTIRSYLSHLRRALRDSDPAGAELLRSNAHRHAVAAGPDRLDSLRFEMLVADARAKAADGGLEGAVRDAEEALALWQGDALSDLADSSVIMAEAARLESLRFSTLEFWVDLCLALGRHDVVIPELEALTAMHPLHEGLRSRQILALYRSGRQADALAVYQDVRLQLLDDLGLEPGPELRRLEQAVLSHAPELEWSPAPASPLGAPDPPDGLGDRPGQGDHEPHEAAAEPRSPTPAVGQPSRPTDRRATPAALGAQAPFVGRDDELAHIDAHLDDAAAGHPRIDFVGGGAGMGKTRLAQEVARRAEARGFAVLWSWCYEGEGAPTFWPWQQVVGACLDAYGDGVLDGLAADHQAHLATLRPLASAAAPGPRLEGGAAGRSSESRFSLFQAVIELLRRATAARPAVVVIDDAHWADSPSLLLLELFAKRADGSRVLLLVTYQEADGTPRHTLQSVLGGLARVPGSQRFKLANLSGGEVAAYLAAAEGVEAATLSDLLYRRTEGNPMFLVEVVEHLRGQGLLTEPEAVGPGDIDLPSSVRDLIVRRTDRLSREARDVLLLASVVGREFDHLTLERVTEHPDAIDDAIEEATAEGLIVDVGSDEGRYRFSHGLVWEGVHGQVPWARRARWNRAIGEALETLVGEAGGPRIKEVAHHFAIASRRYGELVAKAVDYAAASASWALRSLDYEDAVRHFEDGLALLAREPSDTRARRFELLEGLGEALFRSGETERAQSAFLEATEVAVALGDPQRRARAALGYGGRLIRNWHTSAGAMDATQVELLVDALDDLDEGDSDLRVRLLGQVAEDMSGESEMARRDELSRAALDMARRIGEPETIAAAMCSRILALWHPRHLQERIALVEYLAGLCEVVDHPELRLFATHHRFVTRLELGDAAGAEWAQRQHAELAQHLQQPFSLWQSSWCRALRATIAGDLARAEELALQAFEIGSRHGDPDASRVFSAQVGLIHLELGRTEELLVLAEAMMDDDPRHWGPVTAMLSAQLGRDAEAQAVLDDMVARVGAGGHPVTDDFIWSNGMVMLAEAATTIGHRPAAAVLYDALEPYRDQQALSADVLCWGPISRYMGRLACTLGRYDEAKAHLDHARALCRRFDEWLWFGHVGCDLAELLLARRGKGDRATAHRLLDRTLGPVPVLSPRAEARVWELRSRAA